MIKRVFTEGEFWAWYSDDLDFNVSKHFKAREFQCPKPYSIEFHKIHKELIDKLEAVREAFGEPIYITSGYRTQAYQDHLTDRGFKTSKKTSQHVLGKAVDISCKDLRKLKKLHEICCDEFSAVGEALTFVHVDLRKDKQRRWNYF